MKYSLKALLLSALIFPGLGQLLVKHYKTGFSMAAVAFVCIATVISQAFNKALIIAERAQKDGAASDPASIAEFMETSGIQYDSTLINLAMAGLLLCWLVSVIHAYLAGKARDEQESSN